MVYHLVFGNVKTIGIDYDKSYVWATRVHSPEFQGTNRLAILQVNKQIRAEALSVFYHRRTFTFQSATMFARFFRQSRISAERIEAVEIDWRATSRSWPARMSTVLLNCKNLVSVEVNLEDIDAGAISLARAFKFWFMPNLKPHAKKMGKVIDMDRLGAMNIIDPHLDRDQRDNFRQRLETALRQL